MDWQLQTEPAEASKPWSSSAMSKAETKKPVHKTRAGAIEAAIWENDGRDGVFYNFTLARLYKGPDGWRTAPSFSHRNAADIAAASSSAAAWIANKVAEQAPVGDAEHVNGQPSAEAPASL